MLVDREDAEHVLRFLRLVDTALKLMFGKGLCDLMVSCSYDGAQLNSNAFFAFFKEQGRKYWMAGRGLRYLKTTGEEAPDDAEDDELISSAEDCYDLSIIAVWLCRVHFVRSLKEGRVAAFSHIHGPWLTHVGKLVLFSLTLAPALFSAYLSCLQASIPFQGRPDWVGLGHDYHLQNFNRTASFFHNNSNNLESTNLSENGQVAVVSGGAVRKSQQPHVHVKSCLLSAALYSTQLSWKKPCLYKFAIGPQQCTDNYRTAMSIECKAGNVLLRRRNQAGSIIIVGRRDCPASFYLRFGSSLHCQAPDRSSPAAASQPMTADDIALATAAWSELGECYKNALDRLANAPTGVGPGLGKAQSALAALTLLQESQERAAAVASRAAATAAAAGDVAAGVGADSGEQGEVVFLPSAALAKKNPNLSELCRLLLQFLACSEDAVGHMEALKVPQHKQAQFWMQAMSHFVVLRRVLPTNDDLLYACDCYTFSVRGFCLHAYFLSRLRGWKMPVDLDSVRQAAPKKSKASSKGSAGDAVDQLAIDKQTLEIDDIVWGVNNGPAQPQTPLSAENPPDARPPWLVRGPRTNANSDTASINAVSEALGHGDASAMQFNELLDQEGSELGGHDDDEQPIAMASNCSETAALTAPSLPAISIAMPDAGLLTFGNADVHPALTKQGMPLCARVAHPCPSTSSTGSEMRGWSPKAADALGLYHGLVTSVKYDNDGDICVQIL